MFITFLVRYIRFYRFLNKLFNLVMRRFGIMTSVSSVLLDVVYSVSSGILPGLNWNVLRISNARDFNFFFFFSLDTEF